MLAHILATAVGVGSVGLYLAAFFFPEVHRKHDFFWSGMGCFYALVLWLDAGEISTTNLLGHGAGISLMGWFAWQTLSLRRKRTPRDLQTPLTDESWQVFRKEMLSLGSNWLKRLPILGDWFPKTGTGQIKEAVQGEGFRASALKQVDYEFVDDLPLESSDAPKDKPGGVQIPSPQVNSIPTRNDRKLSQKATASSSGEGTRTGPQPRQKPQTLLKKGAVLKDWLLEVITTATKPRPKKPVIIIPPREPATNPDSSQPITNLASSQAPEPAAVEQINGADGSGVTPNSQEVDMSTQDIATRPTEPSESPSSPMGSSQPDDEIQNWDDGED